MSGPTDSRPTGDEQVLDEYLRGGSAVSRHYRALQSEAGDDSAVPAEVDRAVLAAARAAVAPQSSGALRKWLRWSAPVTLAASVVLVLAIVLDTGMRPELQPVATRQSAAEYRADPARASDDVVMIAPGDATDELRVPPAVTRALPPAEPDRAGAAAAVDVAVTAAAQPELRLQEAPATAMPQSAARPLIPPPPSAPMASMESRRMSAAREEALADEAGRNVTSVGEAARRRAAPASAPVAGVETADKFVAEPPSADAAPAEKGHEEPQPWLERIRKLRREGRSAEADAQWRQFRDAYPDYPVASTDEAIRGR